MKRYLILILILSSTLWLSAQTMDSTAFASDEEAVKTVVERFLKAAGNYEIDSIPVLFSENANIGGVSLRDGQWRTYTMSLEDFIKLLESRNEPQKYTEPVTNYTIHIEEGMLARVKADAVVIRNGKAQSNNYDYFTLIKENGSWKILNGSYVSIPIE